jgi:hypothetical protein
MEDADHSVTAQDVMPPADGPRGRCIAGACQQCEKRDRPQLTSHRSTVRAPATRRQAPWPAGEADELEHRTQRDEHLLDELAGALGVATQLRIEDLSPRLRGQRPQEIAIEVLETYWGVGREIHYRSWFELVQEKCGRVGSKDPARHLPSADPPGSASRERWGRRTGRYLLVNE